MMAVGTMPISEPNRANSTLSPRTIPKMRARAKPMALNTAISRMRSRKLIIMVLPATRAMMTTTTMAMACISPGMLPAAWVKFAPKAFSSSDLVSSGELAKRASTSRWRECRPSAFLHLIQKMLQRGLSNPAALRDCSR